MLQYLLLQVAAGLLLASPHSSHSPHTPSSLPPSQSSDSSHCTHTASLTEQVITALVTALGPGISLSPGLTPPRQPSSLLTQADLKR